MAKRNFPLSEVYTLLEPGPVVLLTTMLGDKPNVMTMSWLTMMEFTPPQIGCVVSNRNYSFKAIQETGECVINIPTAELAQAVVGCGNSSGRRVDKFARFGLTSEAGKWVHAPLIKECFASLECRVINTDLVSAYCFFVLEVCKAWRDARLKNEPTLHHRGWGTFVLDGERITLPSRMP